MAEEVGCNTALYSREYNGRLTICDTTRKFCVRHALDQFVSYSSIKALPLLHYTWWGLANWIINYWQSSARFMNVFIRKRCRFFSNLIFCTLLNCRQLYKNNIIDVKVTHKKHFYCSIRHFRTRARGDVVKPCHWGDGPFDESIW